MNLKEIALRIGKHLQWFAADKAIAERTWTDGSGIERRTAVYWQPVAYQGGSRLMVKYVGYQQAVSLTKAEAEKYLAWLDAGNVGRHYVQQRAEAE